ncbi:MAG: hypothetical protein U0821_24275 [Chloroflexota bacterium]
MVMASTPAVTPGGDTLTVRLDERAGTRRRGWRPEPGNQVRRFGQGRGRIEVAGLIGQGGVFADGHAREAEVPGDGSLAGAAAQVMDQITKHVHV